MVYNVLSSGVLKGGFKSKLLKLLVKGAALHWVCAGCLATKSEPMSGPANEDKNRESSQLIFSVDSPIHLHLKAPLAYLFHLGRGVSGPDGQVIHVKDYVGEGTELRFVTPRGKIEIFEPKIKVRGGQSLTDCSFLKLKLKFKRDEIPGSLFADHRKVKIGTHCGEDEAADGFRLKHEKAAWRQAAILELARLFGVPTLDSRRAIVSYEDSTDSLNVSDFPEAANLSAEILPNVTRKAFIFDDTKEYGKKLGLAEVEQMSIFRDRMEIGKLFPVAKGIRIALFNALIGNTDWVLQMNSDLPERMGFINIDILAEVVDGTYQRIEPVMHDFDLATAITGKFRQVQDISIPEEINGGDATDAFKAVYLVLHRIGDKEFFSHSQLEANLGAITDEFTDGRVEALRIATRAGNLSKDKKGEQLLLNHLDAFYTLLPKIEEIL